MNAKKMGFGLMRLPLVDAADPTSVDYDELSKMVDRFLKPASIISILPFLIMEEETARSHSESV